jgi:hypothetical protein
MQMISAEEPIRALGAPVGGYIVAQDEGRA